jgi:penicillin-binding protein 2
MKKLAERQNIIIYGCIICALVLIGKSAQLQIFDSKYRDQAQRTTLDKIVKYPARGMMYDRNSNILVANKPIYDLEVIHNNLDAEMDTVLFCELLGINKAAFNKRINKNWKDPKFSRAVPFIFLNKISEDKFARFQEHLYKFPGFYPVTRNIRTYPHHSAAHVLGFLSEVDQREVETSGGMYQPGDLKGEVGLEKKYESLLRGKKGVEYMLKDNLGRDVGPFEGGRLDSAATSGEDLILSLDLQLQSYAEKLMQNKRGAVIAIEPSTGEILTMVSAPTYDPNLLSFTTKRDSAYLLLSSDTLDRPMINRALSAKYPPGSIFKTIFSAVALQQGIRNPNKKYTCRGVYPVTGQKCHARPGSYDMVNAIKISCNVYFYKLMQDFLDQYGANNPGEGLDTLHAYLERFGISRRLGIDFTFENEGHFPTSQELDDQYRISAPNGWRSSYVTSEGIGQGQVELTTLQMANVATVIANRGFYVKPHFLKSFVSGNYEIPKEYTKKQMVGVEPHNFEPVVEGMRQAVIGGTSRVADLGDIEVCAKTGTSENPHGEDHSVFICFAPKENPKIAIAAYVENAGWGATYAGAISSLMLEKYLKGDINPRRKWLEEKMVSAKILNKEQL